MTIEQSDAVQTPPQPFLPEAQVRVPNTNTWPYNAIGLLLMRWSDGNVYGGTGALIGPSLVVTCSHNLVDQAPAAGQATSIDFYRAYDGVHPVAPIAVRAGFFSNLYRGGQDAWDIALCRLSAPVAPPNPPLPPIVYFSPRVTGAEIVGEFTHLAGYPGNKNGEMWVDYDQVDGVHVPTNTMLYTHDTFGGDSGSPVWTYDPDDGVYFQHGVHVSRTPGTELRRAVLFTRPVVDWIRNAANQPIPPGLLRGL